MITVLSLLCSVTEEGKRRKDMRRTTFLWVLAILLGHAQLGWAADVLVEWNPNPEADLAGYKLHYGTTSRTQGSYDETVVISDKNLTHWSLTLPGDTYYFALTAYDTSGNESGFSVEVSAVVPDLSGPGKPGTPVFIP
jgi:hypothetical protein